jgi:hypothetical protein
MAMVNDARHGRPPLCSPELSAQQLEEMLAELDAICRQARELSTQITLQMAEQKHQEQLACGVIRFPRPAAVSQRAD